MHYYQEERIQEFGNCPSQAKYNILDVTIEEYNK